MFQLSRPSRRLSPCAAPAPQGNGKSSRIDGPIMMGPGQALDDLFRKVHSRRVQMTDKLTRFGPFSSQCRAGNVKILQGPWNEDLFRVLEGFPDLAHDDEVDACSGALEMLNPEMKGWGIYEFYRQKAEQLLAEREARGEATPQPTQTVWARGSMEWLAAQKKSS
jgi:terminase large subunit-like protein